MMIVVTLSDLAHIAGLFVVIAFVILATRRPKRTFQHTEDRDV